MELRDKLGSGVTSLPSLVYHFFIRFQDVSAFTPFTLQTSLSLLIDRHVELLHSHLFRKETYER